MNRVCPSCGYNRNRAGASSCQHCGKPFKATASFGLSILLVLLLVAGGIYYNGKFPHNMGFLKGVSGETGALSHGVSDRISSFFEKIKALKSAAPRQALTLPKVVAEQPPQPVPAQAPDPQQTAPVKKVPADFAKMALISGGGFMMGSPDGVGDSDEHPQHEVKLAAFYMDKNTVTVAEYAACVKAGVCHAASGSGCNSVEDGLSKYPANCILWADACAYCSWSGKALPTEAQWEFAARGGTDTVYSFGDNIAQLQYYSWYDRNSDDETHPVGTKKPNPYGLYDMHGNVWQWVSDWYAYNYNGLSSSNPLRTERTSPYKVLRGGSAVEAADAARSANRFRRDPQKQDKMTGFRCAAPAK